MCVRVCVWYVLCRDELNPSAACTCLCSAVKKWLSWQQKIWEQVRWSFTAPLLDKKTRCSVTAQSLTASQTHQAPQDRTSAAEYERMFCEEWHFNGFKDFNWALLWFALISAAHNAAAAACLHSAMSSSLFHLLLHSLLIPLSVLFGLFTVSEMQEFTATKCNLWSLSS